MDFNLIKQEKQNYRYRDRDDLNSWVDFFSYSPTSLEIVSEVRTYCFKNIILFGDNLKAKVIRLNFLLMMELY